MLLDLKPLRKYRDFRLLFLGQVISFLGSTITYVAVPYQVYELTKDNWMERLRPGRGDGGSGLRAEPAARAVLPALWRYRSATECDT